MRVQGIFQKKVSLVFFLSCWSVKAAAGAFILARPWPCRLSNEVISRGFEISTEKACCMKYARGQMPNFETRLRLLNRNGECSRIDRKLHSLQFLCQVFNKDPEWSFFPMIHSNDEELLEL